MSGPVAKNHRKFEFLIDVVRVFELFGLLVKTLKYHEVPAFQSPPLESSSLFPRQIITSKNVVPRSTHNLRLVVDFATEKG